MRLVLFILKCIVGLFAAIGFLTVAFFVLIGTIASQGEALRLARVEVPEKIVLFIDTAEDVVEARPDNPLSLASLGRVIELHETVQLLERAGTDDRVEGVILRAGRGKLGMAQLQELRQALTDFRGTGKRVTAFSESFGEGGNGTLHYYLASAADEVWLQPSGDMDFTGFVLESPFLKDALARIGVEPQLGQREDYKGAMNTFTDTELPAPQRENLQRLMDSWLEQVVAGVGSARNLEPAAVRELVNRGPYDAEGAREAGLIDHLGYWDQAGGEVLVGAGEDSDFLSLKDYADLIARESGKEKKAGTVALIRGIGPVAMGASDNDPVFGRVVMGSDTVAKAISDALDDDSVDAILFRVNSPGGSYVASDTIWREVQRARDSGKPVVVSMGDLAASGGYFVAAPATKIVAQPGTVTGSIGVVAGKMAIQGLWDNLSINWDSVKAGTNADIWSANEPFTPEQWAILEAALDRTYADFTRKVAAGRGMTQDEVSKAAKGQVWSGADAKEMGLVDALGGYKTALALAKEAADIDPAEPVEIVPFPAPVNAFDYVLQDLMGSNVRSPLLQDIGQGMTRLLRAVAPLVEALEGLSPDGRVERLRAPALQTN